MIKFYETAMSALNIKSTTKQTSFDVVGVSRGHEQALMRLIELTVCVCIKSENAGDFIALMDDDTQYELQDVIQRSLELGENDSEPPLPFMSSSE